MNNWHNLYYLQVEKNERAMEKNHIRIVVAESRTSLSSLLCRVQFSSGFVCADEARECYMMEDMCFHPAVYASIRRIKRLKKRERLVNTVENKKGTTGVTILIP